LANELRDSSDLDKARANLYLSTGRCSIGLKLANEYLKTAQKSVTEISGRVRNQLFDPVESIKQGLNSKNKIANML
jgi:hypothetical protein